MRSKFMFPTRHAAWSSAALLGVLLGSAAPAGSASAPQAFSLLYSFKGGLSDGANPNGITIGGQGNLFGTTEDGGTISVDCQRGNPCGTVFNLLPNQTEKVVLPFNGSFGGNPSGGLTADGLGDLAIPLSDGAVENGSVLELLANGTRRVFPFHSDGNDGSGPNGNLIADNKGNFYGTTQANVLTGGVVFQLSAGGTVSVLHNFMFGSGLSEPLAGLIADSSGNLYGTASAGGTCGAGGGVFELSPPATTGGTWTYNVLYSFCSSLPANGWLPTTALVVDGAGDLYGTAVNGGAFGFGVVFELSPPAVSGGAWSYKLLYSFTGVGDDAYPNTALLFDRAGNLFGGTRGKAVTGNGTVFRLSRNGTETVLHQFNGSDGAIVQDLKADTNGNLYGVASQGGANGYGTVFELTGTGFVP
jgi:uncharacterized repeat protein (TIGR03803 family)